MNLLKKQLVKENYHKETLKITIDMAWPAIVESFFVAFAGLIDSLMVSSLGSYAVAAVGLTTQPKLLGLALFFALNVAISALVARRRGEKKQDSANEILLTAVLFIVIAAIISSIVFVLFAGAIIDFCGSTADTHNDAVVYFRIIMGGMIFNCIQMVLTLEEYTNLIIRCIEILPPEMVIHRITGDGPKQLLTAPLWSGQKKQVLNTIHHTFKTCATWQGRIYTPL